MPITVATGIAWATRLRGEFGLPALPPSALPHFHPLRLSWGMAYYSRSSLFYGVANSGVASNDNRL